MVSGFGKSRRSTIKTLYIREVLWELALVKC